MKINSKDLKKIVSKIKNIDSCDNISKLLRNVILNSYYTEDLFYTIEYTDIITNSNKCDNTFHHSFDEDVLKMVLYILKNNNIYYDEEYFNNILELTKINQALNFDLDSLKFDIDNELYNKKIEPREFNKLLVFLSIDFSNPFISTSDDQLFANAINNNFDEMFANLFDIYASDVESKNIFCNLKKYSPIICNIFLKNDDYVNLLFKRKEKLFVESTKLGYFKNNLFCDLEYQLFTILVGIFMSKIEELNYDYSSISRAMTYIMNYVSENISDILNDNYQISIDVLEDIKQIMLEILYKQNVKCKRLN